MGLIGQTGMITPGSDVPGAQSIVYGEQGSTSETEITAGQLGEGATATVMDQGIGGDTGFGFDTSSAGEGFTLSNATLTEFKASLIFFILL